MKTDPPHKPPFDAAQTERIRYDHTILARMDEHEVRLALAYIIGAFPQEFLAACEPVKSLAWVQRL